MSTSVERLTEIMALGAVKPAEGPGAFSRPDTTSTRWSREQLSGRLTEISGQGACASLTAAVGLVLDAHRAGEPAAWIRLPGSSFYPPDVADSGVDLDALIVVRAPDTRRAARAAERLVRSGAFGLVILDLTCTGPGHRRAADSIPIGLQGRLIALAQRHDAAVVCVTAKSARDPSIGSMVSLRAEVRRERAEPGYFRCALRVLKDKRRGPGWTDAEVVRGPTGVR